MPWSLSHCGVTALLLCFPGLSWQAGTGGTQRRQSEYPKTRGRSGLGCGANTTDGLGWFGGFSSRGHWELLQLQGGGRGRKEEEGTGFSEHFKLRIKPGLSSGTVLGTMIEKNHIGLLEGTI